jgi:dolichol-phosphate mannosyltransferase
MTKNKILVITPTYNEIENIEKFIIEINHLNLNLLIIDDNSPDLTYKVVEKYTKKNNNIHLIKRDGKKGLGSAYRDGFKWFLDTNFSHCIEMDVDFSHRISDLKKLIKEIEDFDLIIGSRYITGGGSKGWGYKRKKLSLYANRFAKKILKIDINDMTSGFRVFSRNALTKIDFENVQTNGYGFQIEMTYLAVLNNLKIKEFPIIFHERRLGKSKMNYRIILEAIILLFRLLISNEKKR